MSGATVAEFIAYWEDEGQAYVRRGDYDWMASLVPGKRVLDIGCGIGFATQALACMREFGLAADAPHVNREWLRYRTRSPAWHDVRRAACPAAALELQHQDARRAIATMVHRRRARHIAAVDTTCNPRRM